MKRRPLRFYCFSPAVMVITCIVELTLLVYTIFRYKFDAISRLVVAVVFFLAVFQLAEYNVCRGSITLANVWSRIGFIAITTLPPLGLHLLQRITGKGWPSAKWLAYGTAGIWILLFAFSQRTFAGHICAGNYVIFKLTPSLDRYYYFYYYGWLLLTMSMALFFAAITKKSVRISCVLLLIGYGVFLIPTTVVNTLDPTTTDGIPSIMCGFAIIFAFILVFGIMPQVRTLPQSGKTAPKLKTRSKSKK